MNGITVFKVLRDGKSLFDHGKYTLQYHPGKWTCPELGKIYAFRDLHYAVRWSADYHDVTVWEAEAEISKDGTCMMCSDENRYLWLFWKWYLLFLEGKASGHPAHLPTTYSPNGTVLCNKLRITKKCTNIK